VQVCRAEACQAMGAEALLAHARQHLGCGLHAESGDGRFKVEPAYCLGLCASSPAITVDGQVHARMTPHKLDALVAQAREAA
jgi:formate dehydrogenase subunit gamma